MSLNELSDKLLSQGWHWSAHTHPGLSDNFLMASGFPGDMQALQIFKQERSLIINSASRRSILISRMIMLLRTHRAMSQHIG